VCRNNEWRDYLMMVAVVRRKRQPFTSISRNTGMWKYLPCTSANLQQATEAKEKTPGGLF
jgi:hypothetical protein